MVLVFQFLVDLVCLELADSEDDVKELVYLYKAHFLLYFTLHFVKLYENVECLICRYYDWCNVPQHLISSDLPSIDLREESEEFLHFYPLVTINIC